MSDDTVPDATPPTDAQIPDAGEAAAAMDALVPEAAARQPTTRWSASRSAAGCGRRRPSSPSWSRSGSSPCSSGPTGRRCPRSRASSPPRTPCSSWSRSACSTWASRSAGSGGRCCCGDGLPDPGQGLDRDPVPVVAGQLPRPREARRRLPRLPAADQQHGVAEPDLRHGVHRAHPGHLHDRHPGDRGGVLELPQWAPGLHPGAVRRRGRHRRPARRGAVHAAQLRAADPGQAAAAGPDRRVLRPVRGRRLRGPRPAPAADAGRAGHRHLDDRGHAPVLRRQGARVPGRGDRHLGGRVRGAHRLAAHSRAAEPGRSRDRGGWHRGRPHARLRGSAPGGHRDRPPRPRDQRLLGDHLRVDPVRRLGQAQGARALATGRGRRHPPDSGRRERRGSARANRPAGGSRTPSPERATHGPHATPPHRTRLATRMQHLEYERVVSPMHHAADTAGIPRVRHAGPSPERA